MIGSTPRRRPGCGQSLAYLLVATLCGCELGIQAGVARVETDEANMIAPPRGASAEPPALPKLSTDPSGLLGMTPQHVLARARSHGGKALMVNLWASFCGSCKDELPLLLGLEREFGPQGIGLLLLTADRPEDRPKAVALLREFGVMGEAHHVAGPIGRFTDDLEPRWRGALPATLLIDTNGRVRHFWNGPVIDAELRPVLEGFLAGRDIDGVTDVAASAN